MEESVVGRKDGGNVIRVDLLPTIDRLFQGFCREEERRSRV
jgi:hypothetical protein